MAYGEPMRRTLLLLALLSLSTGCADGVDLDLDGATPRLTDSGGLGQPDRGPVEDEDAGDPGDTGAQGDEGPADDAAQDDAAQDDPDASDRDAGTELPDAELLAPDAELLAPDAEAPPPRRDLGRGLRWVRTNETFISALTVQMGPPPARFVDTYFDTFNANAVHLWQQGVPSAMNGWLAARPNARWLAWLRDDGSSLDGGQLMGGFQANRPGRIGWQIGDEPTSLEAFEALRPGFEAVRQADPDALLVLNFSQSAGDALDAMIERSIRDYDVDVISYDRYSRSRSMWSTIGYFREQGLRYEVPYWRYLNSYTDPAHALWTPTDTRWDALLGPLFGYTGHTWFLYQIDAMPGGLETVLFDRERDFDAAPTPLFALIADLNVQLAHLGRVISQLTSTDVRYISGIAGVVPDGIREWAAGAGGDPYITSIMPVDVAPLVLQELVVGYFQDDWGERYLMIQNQNRAGGSFPNGLDAPTGVRIEFNFAAAPAGLDRGQVLVFDHHTGRSAPAALLDTEGGGRAFQTRLDAGDIVLLKYASGRGFAAGR